MAIPDFQTLMLPLLKFSSNYEEHSSKDATAYLANYFKLTEEEKNEVIPSGKEPIIRNRTGWAITYFKKALLLEATKRAHFKITQRGLEVLSTKPDKLCNNYLTRFPEFREFKSIDNSPRNNGELVTVLDEEDNGKTPEETMDLAYLAIRKALAQELLNKIQSLPPSFFEKLVVELLVKMGYGGSLRDAGRALGKSGDGGIDGIIKEDKLGLDVIYIQAKRWNSNNPVGRPDVQGFVGALAGHGAKKGVFITTSRFTPDAKAYTPRNETKIVLIDGEQLSQYMIDYNLGVATESIYEVKRIDIDYFGDE
ncbi:restriction endonuclease [Pontibacter sp. JH31]|uniref:Restriction endonuclease n=1 Tax=Pontibacter aquaedesilientis TaxID=2766980 RepID=A0ABR7XJG7_9BACT|nr:restriction endonuclease [Pontibacter aquaedesilientis]MBD1398421.1 restriction endonuclease [Pontibacter aquaedesilientis]